MNINQLTAKLSLFVSYVLFFFISAFVGKAVSYIDVALFALGLLLGFALLELDEYYLYQHYDPEKKRLSSRSFLFLLALFPLGIFLLTSTGSAVGVGMFLGIISVLALEMFAVRNNKEAFETRFLSQLNREITNREQAIFTNCYLIFTGLYAVFVIFFGR